MGKLYSLDTYREVIKEMPKSEALNGIGLNSQEDLDVHFKNIEQVKQDKEYFPQYKSIFNNTDDVS